MLARDNAANDDAGLADDHGRTLSIFILPVKRNSRPMWGLAERLVTPLRRQLAATSFAGRCEIFSAPGCRAQAKMFDGNCLPHRIQAEATAEI
jgi:hypothetical protein